MKRRTLLKVLASGIVIMHSPALFASTAPAHRPKRVIWIVQRGAVDALHTLVPTFEQKALTALRPDLFNGLQNSLPLAQGFALHPALSTMQTWFQKKELLAVVATGSGYQGRSHFDGQDYLESGLAEANQQSGWLGRAMELLQSDAVAMAKVAPLSFRASLRGQNYYPGGLSNASDSLFDDLQRLYQYDNGLQDSLMAGLETKNAVGHNSKKRTRATFATLCEECAALLRAKPNLQFAMLEIGGWDTHKAQVARLNREFSTFDQGLAKLKASLGDEWQNTLVILNSEFGRTVKQNGTGGTDHGTGSAMFFAGGAIKGGRILGEWPSLEQADLFEGRDLRATSNTFAWIATAISQHLELQPPGVKAIFPDHLLINEQLI